MNKTLYRQCTVEELFNIVPPPVALPTPVQVSVVADSIPITPLIVEATGGDVVGTPGLSFFQKRENIIGLTVVVVGVSIFLIYQHRQQKKRRH